MTHTRTVLARSLVLTVLLLGASLTEAADALLVVAHGARTPGWNDRVVAAVQRIAWHGPVGVAFLMEPGAGHALDEVAARLDEAGASRIIVVPLLVSSYSSHYEEIRYYLGQRREAPGHAHYTPLKTRAELKLATGMDDDPLVSEILADQVRPLVQEPARESLVLVAHGPNEDEENLRWLQCLQSHAARLQEKFSFRRIEVVTLRDDAPKPVRDAATEELRGKVRAAGRDSRVLVAPVLISVGLIQRQIRERLAGLDYVMTQGGLAEHPLAAEWIKRQALKVEAAAAAAAAVRK